MSLVTEGTNTGFIPQIGSDERIFDIEHTLEVNVANMQEQLDITVNATAAAKRAQMDYLGSWVQLRTFTPGSDPGKLSAVLSFKATIAQNWKNYANDQAAAFDRSAGEFVEQLVTFRPSNLETDTPAELEIGDKIYTHEGRCLIGTDDSDSVVVYGSLHDLVSYKRQRYGYPLQPRVNSIRAATPGEWSELLDSL